MANCLGNCYAFASIGREPARPCLHLFRTRGLEPSAPPERRPALSTNRLIDLYSDTQTKPSAGMRKAMADAEVGDEQRGEDPSTNLLQERVAELLGKEAALFLPSGTMCNQIAMLVHCRQGDEIIGAEVTHLFTSEAGGASALAGAQTWPIRCERGIFTGADVTAAVRAPGRHNPISRVVIIEQTVNRGGGAIWSVDEIADVAKATKQHGLVLHMDGARLMNAAVSSGVAANKMTAHVDTAWTDLSKGLGCPVGGVLVGSRAFIDEAWRWKHRLGGALRQSGILAAAGLYALDHNIQKLAEDHENAVALGNAVAAIEGLKLFSPRIESNMVFFESTLPEISSRQIFETLLARGVRMGMTYGNMIRAVTHLDVSSDDITRAGEILGQVVADLKAGLRKAS
jgi:threonine aldolase